MIVALWINKQKFTNKNTDKFYNKSTEVTIKF